MRSFEDRLQEYFRSARPHRAPGATARLFGMTTATAAASVMAASAEAAVIWNAPTAVSTATGQQVTSGYGYGYSGRTSADLDLNDDLVNDFRLRISWSYDGSVAFGDLVRLHPGALVAQGVFASGSAIGASAPLGLIQEVFGRSFGSTFGPWVDAGGSGFAGVQVGGHFGWIRIEFDSSHIHAVDWAYESVAAAPIHAGDIPEPSAGVSTGLALLALGARGVRRRRRKHS